MFSLVSAAQRGATNRNGEKNMAFKRIAVATAPVKVVSFDAAPDHSGVNALMVVNGLRYSCWWLGEEVKSTLVGPAYGASAKAMHIAAQRCRNAFTAAIRERTTQEYRDATKALYAA